MNPSRPIDIDYLIRNRWWKDVLVGAPDACWPWLRSRGSHGYGQTWDRVTVRLAHRVAWVLTHGQQIPDGLTIDHLCRNRSCCNPSHLRLLSNLANARDNGQTTKTHCPQGHPYDDENTVINSRGHRLCRACRDHRNRARRAKRSEQGPSS